MTDHVTPEEARPEKIEEAALWGTVRMGFREGGPWVDAAEQLEAKLDSFAAQVEQMKAVVEAARRHYKVWASIKPPESRPLPIQEIGRTLAAFDSSAPLREGAA